MVIIRLTCTICRQKKAQIEATLRWWTMPDDWSETDRDIWKNQFHLTMNSIRKCLKREGLPRMLPLMSCLQLLPCTCRAGVAGNLLRGPPQGRKQRVFPKKGAILETALTNWQLQSALKVSSPLALVFWLQEAPSLKVHFILHHQGSLV